jgi:hypothetical protein
MLIYNSFFDWDRLKSKSERGALALVTNLGALDPAVQEIATGLILRKASVDEAREFQLCIDATLQQSISPMVRNPYETAAERVANQHGWNLSVQPLDPEHFRYHVIEVIDGTNAPAHSLAEASVLAGHDLEIGLYAVYGPEVGAGVGRNPGFDTFIEDTSGDDDSRFTSLGPDDVSDLSEVYKRFIDHDNAKLDLRSRLMDYRAIRLIPRRSSLRIVAHFAILESLLTHTPQPTDPYDSITRQIRQKVALLNGRFRHKLDYAEFNASPETVWKKLYKVRSLLAHGAKPDFSIGELQALKDLPTVDAFIQKVTARVMRQAVYEPELLTDLRNC